MNRLDIQTTRIGQGPAGLTLVVDGVSLVDLVAAYEGSRGYEPAGAYGGLVPERLSVMADRGTYLLGTSPDQLPAIGSAWLLGCSCGEVGCWPLVARIEVSPRRVRWTDFSQPFRESWDYTDFGPFVFTRGEYEATVARAARMTAGPA